MQIVKAKSHVFALIFALTLAGCDGGFHMSAQVVDADGNPIPSATASASREKSPAEFNEAANKAGCLSLGGLTAPGNYNFHVNISARGYKPLQLSMPTIQHNTFRIVLAKQTQVFTGQAISINESDWQEHCHVI
jgi:hypothetical protein